MNGYCFGGCSSSPLISSHKSEHELYFGLACQVYLLSFLWCCYYILKEKHMIRYCFGGCSSSPSIRSHKSEHNAVYRADRCMEFYGLIIPHRRTLYIQKLKLLTFIDSPSKLVQSNDLNYPYPNLFLKSLKIVSRPLEKSV